MIVLSMADHHLVTLLSSSFHTRPRQVTSFTSSAMNTAVVDMNISPGLVLAYLILSPNMAFCPVSVTKLQYKIDHNYCEWMNYGARTRKYLEWYHINYHYEHLSRESQKDLRLG